MRVIVRNFVPENDSIGHIDINKSIQHEKKQPVVSFFP